ncbi:MAG TPA: class I SAM-dependent methyltransferase [Thermomicrobiales bacterium]|nr:class I SAM-dependent methyltransferase [Thermomicrobiales bacterium]
MPRDFGAWLDPFAGLLVADRAALDIGCGNGHDTRVLLDAGLTVAAFDLEPGNIQRASRRAPAASFVVADLRTGLPFLPCTFDLIVASLSLHYFDRATTNRIICDIQRVTRPGATLLARVNAVGDTASLWGVGTEHEPDVFEVRPGHIKRFFTEESLSEALEPCFSVLTIDRQETIVTGQRPKQTLVVSATRHDP